MSGDVHLSQSVSLIYANLKGYAYQAACMNRVEQALLFAHLASRLAFFVPFGMWQDDEMEAWLVKFVRKMHIPIRTMPAVSGSCKRKRVLHLAPKLVAGGGYRLALLANVRALASEYDQIVLNSSSSSEVIDEDFVISLQNSGAEVIQCHFSGYIEHAIEIARAIQSTGADIILNYATFSPSDFMACAWVKAKLNRPIVRFNYGDSYPILGKYTADVWVEMRQVGAEFSKRFRGIASPIVLPLPVPARNTFPLSRAELGLPENATVSLTVSPYWKLVSTDRCNYFDSILEILDANPTHHHLLVCPDIPLTLRQQVVRHPAGIRLHILGYRTDIDALMRIADLAIEGFPLIGATVRVEYVAAGLPVLAWTNAKFSGFGDTDEIPPDYPFAASSPNAWREKAQALLESNLVRQNAAQWLQENAVEPLTVQDYTSELNLIISGAIAMNQDSAPQRLPERLWRHELRYDTEYVCSQALAAHPLLAKSQVMIAIAQGPSLNFHERWKIGVHLSELARLPKRNGIYWDSSKTQLGSVFRLCVVIWLFVGSRNYFRFLKQFLHLQRLIRRFVGERIWRIIAALYHRLRRD